MNIKRTIPRFPLAGFRLCPAAFFFIAVLAVPLAMADERILEFTSEIDVLKNGSARVAERIVVRAEGREIKRGIFRDVLLSRGQRIGVESVTRDGAVDGFRTERQGGSGVRIYIGRPEYMLPRGTYRYELIYTVNNVIAPYDDHDQFYWNITGNNWSFPIDWASASIYFPDDIPQEGVQVTAYTGSQGERGQAFETSTTDAGMVSLQTTHALGAREGLTAVVGFPKGQFELQPVSENEADAAAAGAGWFTGSEELDYKDRTVLTPWIPTSIAVGSTLVFFVFAWIFVGIDPMRGRIRDPGVLPADLSPAVARYLWLLDFDRMTLTAALISMASKGHLTITQKDKHFEIARGDAGRESLAEDEKVVSKTLRLRKDKTPIRTTSKNGQRFVSAARELEEHLDKTYQGEYFRLNRFWFGLGLILACTSIGLAAYYSVPFYPVESVATSIVLTLSTFFVLHAVIMMVRDVRFKTQRFAGELFLFIISGVIAGICVSLLIKNVPHVLTMAAITAGAICRLYYDLLTAPTRKGRDALDVIEGLRLKLTTARGPAPGPVGEAELTFTDFERYFAYAVALNAADEWGEQFRDALGAATPAEQSSYRPSWYHTDSNRHSNVAMPIFLANEFGSGFSSAVGKASTPVSSGGSSGGYSGGGFSSGGSSGGGGGGGGGGGW